MPSTFAHHLPLIFSSETGVLKLAGHMARANPQWRHFLANSSVLAIFRGPHSYISPSWYASTVNVPTWNYAVVHVHGQATVMEDPEQLECLLEAMTGKFEQDQIHPWQLQLPKDLMADMMNDIVGFEITIDRVESKFKLSQNREQKDRDSVIHALSEKQDDMSRELSALMHKVSFASSV